MWGTHQTMDPISESALARHYPGLDLRFYDVFNALLRTAHAVSGHIGLSVEPYGLSDGRFRVLMVLAMAEPAPLTPSDIAERAGVTRATVTGLLDGLEAAGLVERRNHRTDRRRILVSLTVSARERLEAAVPEHVKSVLGVMSILSEDEHAQLRALMDKLYQALSQPAHTNVRKN